jgi:hypothetical protein
MPKPNKQWRPVVGDLVGIGAFALAIVTYLVQPNWEVGTISAFIAIALFIFAAARHESHVLLRVLIGAIVVIGFVAVIWRPLWLSFHRDYPRVAFNWPITFNAAPAPPAEPPDMPPLHLLGPPLSKWGKAMFTCPYPSNIDAADPAQAKAQIRRNADIYGKALGLDLALNDIPYGIRFDVTASDPGGQAVLRDVQRYTVQMEAAANGIFITFTLDFAGAMAILGQVPLDRDSEVAKSYDKAVEQFGFAPGSCRLI